jgi:integrase
LRPSAKLGKRPGCLPSLSRSEVAPRNVQLGIRKRYVTSTPFNIGMVSTVSLEREIPRHRRFESAEDETKLLSVADSHLRAIIVALLDTTCRPGEVLSLQWQDVSLERREFVVQATKAKT